MFSKSSSSNLEGSVVDMFHFDHQESWKREGYTCIYICIYIYIFRALCTFGCWILLESPDDLHHQCGEQPESEVPLL